MSLVRLGFLLFFGASVLTAGRAHAGEEDDRAAHARGLYELGMQRFLLADYDGAIARWQEGFRTKPAPEFLYNIGQAYRRMRRPADALPYYQRYLDLSPTAPERAEVERIVASLTAETRAAPAPTEAPAATTTSSDRPLLRKPWFWAVVGGGALVVAAAIVIGVEVPRRHDPAQQLPPVSFALRF